LFLAHSIRLREPWDRELTEELVRWRRSFHAPTGLESDDDLWLMIADLPPAAIVGVNGTVLSRTIDGAHSRFDLTPVLAEKNRVAIEVPCATGCEAPAAFPYDVRLAIVGRS
jgi:hypothetical protein